MIGGFPGDQDTAILQGSLCDNNQVTYPDFHQNAARHLSSFSSLNHYLVTDGSFLICPLGTC